MSTPLGDFLRARRDATRPEAVGLPTGTRRRAPGLRRSEVATLAGISVEYLVRIEQGRDRNPSVSVVNALADALRLDVDEREHLRYLSKISGGVCVASAPTPGIVVRDDVLRLLDQLEPGVAVVTNRLGDLLARTSGFGLVAGRSGLLDRARPNLTRFVFTDPRARKVFPDWDQVADECSFNVWLGPSAERSSRFQAELATLAGDEFTRRMRRHDLPSRAALRWQHPDVGELRLLRETLDLPAADAQQLVVYLAADDATSDGLARLRHDSTPLRAVP